MVCKENIELFYLISLHFSGENSEQAQRCMRMQDASMCLAGTTAVCHSPGLTHFGRPQLKRRRNNSRQRTCCRRRVPLSLPKWSILGARYACKAKVRLWHKTAASPLLRSGSPPIYSSANSLIALALQSKAIGTPGKSRSCE